MDRWISNKELNRLEAAEGKAVLDSKPRTLMAILTTACNLKCIMCTRIKSKPQSLPFEVVEKVYDLLPYLERVDWQGGEVFLVDYFKELFLKTAGFPHILQNINNKFNYLPDYSLRCVSDELKLPMSDIFRISTFYNAFSLVPRGRNIIKVCMGTACYVKGGGKIIQTVENNFGITVGETTSDLNVTLDTVNCIGCCGQSPVMSVNDDIFGNLNTKKVLNVIDQYISDEVSDEKIEV